MTDELKQWEYDRGYDKGYAKGKADILDVIRAEIEQEYKVESEHSYGQGLRRALEIIDKYREVSK